MKTVTGILLLMVVLSCTTHKSVTHAINHAPGTQATALQDGLTYSSAVVVQASGETEGIKKEYKWLQDHYPGYHLHSQVLSVHEKKPYDILIITTATGDNKSVYFDISGFYGKF